MKLLAQLRQAVAFLGQGTSQLVLFALGADQFFAGLAQPLLLGLALGLQGGLLAAQPFIQGAQLALALIEAGGQLLFLFLQGDAALVQADLFLG